MGSKKNRPTLKLASILFNWAELMGNTGSIHGLSWFNYFDSIILKGAVLVFALGCIGILPCFLFVMTNSFLADDSILAKTATSKLDELTFPRITICNPFYFNVARIQGNSTI